MRILIVGGGGMVGGDAAIRLQSLGHDVEIASRSAPQATTPMAKMPFHTLDYVNDTPDAAWLGGYDAIVFAAGNDIRHIPKDGDPDKHWHRVNSEAVPAFAKAAKAAGVKTFILIGSFYPQAAPHLLGKIPYVDSRDAADRGTRALADDSFKVIVLNAPYIIGHVDGLVQPGFTAFVNWATGKSPVPRFMIPGGVNVITATTLTDAIVGALNGGQNGKAYLIGDENLSFQDYFGGYFRHAGDANPLEVRNEEHPFARDASIFWGRGNDLFYDPDPAEVAELGYRRNDVDRAQKEIVEAYK
ncbi:NAD-dependent epimerase/dehydratase family protein [Sphingomonas crocodyli]|uniref:NAD-dependent epimerase/dehydratase family protein n=1 Tax=Sphingomonas crocodyli TaxID=1979270 RepID=A0A437LWG4_9SPHN|nr:NAD-dependent epimerase/dehydratase family protein [Sphingomonas crocodyli]RVT89738.1 NAD-dependent epimerase/dehydratase family protein [Sphingomonas crocodyli]